MGRLLPICVFLQSLAFMKNANIGVVTAWTFKNRICGPETTVVAFVGMTANNPVAFSLYGCNPGAAGVRVPQMCVCAAN